MEQLIIQTKKGEPNQNRLNFLLSLLLCSIIGLILERTIRPKLNIVEISMIYTSIPYLIYVWNNKVELRILPVILFIVLRIILELVLKNKSAFLIMRMVIETMMILFGLNIAVGKGIKDNFRNLYVLTIKKGYLIVILHFSLIMITLPITKIFISETKMIICSILYLIIEIINYNLWESNSKKLDIIGSKENKRETKLRMSTDRDIKTSLNTNKEIKDSLSDEPIEMVFNRNEEIMSKFNRTNGSLSIVEVLKSNPKVAKALEKDEEIKYIAYKKLEKTIKNIEKNLLIATILIIIVTLNINFNLLVSAILKMLESLGIGSTGGGIFAYIYDTSITITIVAIYYLDSLSSSMKKKVMIVFTDKGILELYDDNIKRINYSEVASIDHQNVMLKNEVSIKKISKGKIVELRLSSKLYEDINMNRLFKDLKKVLGSPIKIKGLKYKVLEIINLIIILVLFGKMSIDEWDVLLTIKVLLCIKCVYSIKNILYK